MGKTEKFIRRKLISTALDVYEMPDLTLPTIQARGNREICIEGCKGILEYAEGRIKLDCGSLVVSLVGDSIEITAFSDIQTVITGDILSIEFEGTGD